MTTIIKTLDLMIDDLLRKGLNPESIIIGRDRCVNLLVELSMAPGFKMEPGKRKIKLRYKNIPIVVCESDMIEVVPNAKHLIGF